MAQELRCHMEMHQETMEPHPESSLFSILFSWILQDRDMMMAEFCGSICLLCPCVELPTLEVWMTRQLYDGHLSFILRQSDRLSQGPPASDIFSEHYHLNHLQSGKLVKISILSSIFDHCINPVTSFAPREPCCCSH